MKSSKSNEKHGPINIYEDNSHYFVQIHPQDRERAKKIEGRQWDGNRKIWVYPKDFSTYNEIVAEFKKDADSFKIQSPKDSDPRSNLHDDDSDICSDYSDYEELMAMEDGDYDESYYAIENEIDTNISDGMSDINKSLKEIIDTLSISTDLIKTLNKKQDQAKKILSKISKSSEEKQNEPNEPEKITLDVCDKSDLNLIEKALIEIATDMGNGNDSLRRIFEIYSPLDKPTEFVNYAHEMVRRQLEILVGDSQTQISFRELIDKAKSEKFFYSGTYDKDRVIPILFHLNNIRNLFAHPRDPFSKHEQIGRSIIYMMNLSLVWSKIYIDSEEMIEQKKSA